MGIELTSSLRRRVIGASIAVAVLMATFPPWVYTFDRTGTHRTRSAGYAFVGAPPPPESTGVAFGVRVDIARLVIQWLAVAGCARAALLLTPGAERQRNGEGTRRAPAQTEGAHPRYLGEKHSIRCPQCQKGLRVPSGMNGYATCPHCSNKIQVDAKDSDAQF
jgi:DNA-directed RNA polymerase subunit RPC12/RpoP